MGLPFKPAVHPIPHLSRWATRFLLRLVLLLLPLGLCSCLCTLSFFSQTAGSPSLTHGIEVFLFRIRLALCCIFIRVTVFVLVVAFFSWYVATESNPDGFCYSPQHLYKNSKKHYAELPRVPER